MSERRILITFAKGNWFANQFIIEWHDSKMHPECKPDMRYPTGIDLDFSRGRKPSCKVELPYPAERIGAYVIECRFCKLRVGCTTAGRVDDPRSVTMECKTQ